MKINEKKFTQEQLEAINAEGSLIVVSASAGSGKTSVLVERVIKKILDKYKLKDFLIVTFTNVAANEMKERIKNRILEESTRNINILSELKNLDNAFICTIDSFCMYLVKQNLGITHISNDFKIANEQDIKIIRSEAISSVFEEIYKNNNYELINFINNFSKEINESQIIKLINTWLDFSANIADTNEYIENSLKNFEIPFENTKVYEFLKKYLKTQIEFVINLLKKAVEICEFNEELKKKYIPAIKNNCLELDLICQNNNLIDIIQKIKKFNFEKLKPTKQCEEKDKVKSILDNCKRIISKFQKISTEENNFIQKSIIKNFLFICQQVDKKIHEIKFKKNIFEFSDIEKMAYRILKNKKLKINFKEIIIDEFQDINDIQNKIFDLIAQKMFIVGDYKQSIYGFRGADPEIFELKKKKNNCINIKLTKNFRSKKSILDFINTYFEKNMTKYTNEIEYIKNEKLIYGANFFDKNDNCVEIINDIYDDSTNKEDKECDFICDKIKFMINSRFKVNKNGELKNINLSDICIMCRNFNKYSKILFEKFRANNIKFKTNDASDFLNSQETKFLISILEILDNKHSEVPLTEVILNDFFDFKIHEILKIKQSFNNLNLYNSIEEYSKLNNFISKKCIYFIEYLDNLAKNDLYKIIIELIYDLENKFGKNIYYDEFLQITNEFINNNDIINIKNFIDYILNSKNFNFLEDFNHEDAVLITSIHKAKGKEFPVCFLLGGLSRNFDNNIIFDSNLGIGLKIRENNSMLENSSIFFDGIEFYKKYKETSEKLRVLYVAFTRAKEKLFILSDNIITSE